MGVQQLAGNGWPGMSRPGQPPDPGTDEINENQYWPVTYAGLQLAGNGKHGTGRHSPVNLQTLKHMKLAGWPATHPASQQAIQPSRNQRRQQLGVFVCVPGLGGIPIQNLCSTIGKGGERDWG